jgi:FkbM family methyltransferase
MAEMSDTIIRDKYFKDKTDGFFVECGAADGLLLSVCKYFEDKGWSGINIEPVPYLFQQLIKNRPNSRNINLAISNFIGTHKFIDLKHTSEPNGIIGCGYLDILDKKQNNPSTIYTTFNVNVTKFSQIFTENRPIDLFVLDVEGTEIQALEGILEIPKEFYPEIFCIEINKIDINKLDSMLCDYYTLDYETEIDRIYKRK